MSSLKSGFLNLSKSDPSLLETKIPAFLYGTAWKKERTTHLVTEALRSGFNGVDTAAQPKHYREDLVGDALRVIEFGKERRREDLYIQTKFTSINGQDPQNLPYNPHHPLPSQIRSSVASSLHNLRPSNPANSNQAPEQCLDCLVLHSPLPQFSETLSAWQTLEEYVPHPIRTLGISNVNLPTLKSLWDAVRIKPAIVQNRFYPATAYDVALRKFCVEKGIVYQSFWTLTANPGLLSSEPVGKLSVQVGVDRAVALYCLVLGLKNVVVLNGTTNKERMRSDLKGLDQVRAWIGEDGHEELWHMLLMRFKTLIGEK